MPRRSNPSIRRLLAEERLQEITADVNEAADLLSHAEAHLVSARMIGASDPEGAYQLVYDAMRKSVNADMLARGLRARSDRPGAHAAVVAYAEEALAGVADGEALANLDRMRRSRNRTEYGAGAVTRSQLEADLGHAEAIVRAVASRLRGSAR
jgi:hypothetical protein